MVSSPAVLGRGLDPCCSGGGWGEGYLQTERFELLDEVALASVPVDAAFVVVGAKVAVGGVGVGEQVPDDDEDGTGDGDEGFAFAAAFDDAAVAFAEEGVGAGGGRGGAAGKGFQVGGALGGLPPPARGARPDALRGQRRAVRP